jgi:adenylylsulfate kinase
MIEKLIPITQRSEETLKRSVVKTISYRVVILILDFVSIYLFTGQVKVAVGFMLVSNIYTTIGYFIHERVWGKIKWGKLIYKNVNAN